MKKSVQMYAIRALASHDMEKALKTVSEIGYNGVEFAGFFEHSAPQIKEWLDKYNLTVSGAHVSEELIFDRPQETIEFHKTIGNSMIICPWAKLETAEDVKVLAEKFKKVAPLFHAAGMTLSYHNHAHEFEKVNGECIIDLLAKELPKEILSLEFDVYWVYRGNQNPVEYLTKYQERISLFHAKDGNMTDGLTLGKGEVDMKAVFAFAKAHDLDWAVVESEASEEENEQVEAIRTDYLQLVDLMA